jgi:hypothetical protein
MDRLNELILLNEKLIFGCSRFKTFHAFQVENQRCIAERKWLIKLDSES